MQETCCRPLRTSAVSAKRSFLVSGAPVGVLVNNVSWNGAGLSAALAASGSSRLVRR